MNEHRETLFHRACLPALMCWSVLVHAALAGMLLSDKALLHALLVWTGLCTVPAVAFAVALPLALRADRPRTAPTFRTPAPRRLTPRAAFPEGT